MAIPTDFSVTTANVSPIANPDRPIDAPMKKAAKDAAATNAPSLNDSEEAVTTPSPNVFEAKPADPVVPPFPLNHARILYDNLFEGGDAVQTNGVNGEYTLIPNTFLSWNFAAAGESVNLDIRRPSEKTPIDTVCIGAHTLADVSNLIELWVSPGDGGEDFIQIASIPISDNRAIMWHNDDTYNARRVRIRIRNATGSAKIGVVYAGIALQMQRPFFSGFTPTVENRNVRYYDAWSESGNIIARSRRAVNLEASYSWNNINDGWYRQYFQPFRNTAEELPFFIAWNLAEYPDDVAYVLGREFNTSYSGTRNLRSVSFEGKGTP